MEQDTQTNGKKTVSHVMRALHRDLGFFLVGLTLVYSLSGIVLVYRDTHFLKHERMVEKILSPGMSEAELGQAMRIRDFRIEKTEGDLLYFETGQYNLVTGMVRYTEYELPGFLKPLTVLHKVASQDIRHVFSVLTGVVLLFLCISSFWMFSPGTRLFNRGIILAAAGLIVVTLLLLLWPGT